MLRDLTGDADSLQLSLGRTGAQLGQEAVGWNGGSQRREVPQQITERHPIEVHCGIAARLEAGTRLEAQPSPTQSECSQGFDQRSAHAVDRTVHGLQRSRLEDVDLLGPTTFRQLQLI